MLRLWLEVLFLLLLAFVVVACIILAASIRTLRELVLQVERDARRSRRALERRDGVLR